VDHTLQGTLGAAGDTKPSPRPGGALPGEPGFWTFIAADATLFALLFFQFSLDRSHHVALFDAGQKDLLVLLGAANTIVLVTSSWLLARGVRSLADATVALRWISGTIGLGIAFAILKISEYVFETHFGHTPSTSAFFMYYFIITGIHLLHLIVGVVALSAIGWRLKHHDDQRHNRVILECGASYWHLIDLLWMFTFPLLYLAR
jgi:nitric oxide reductase NorE protein